MIRMQATSESKQDARRHGAALFNSTAPSQRKAAFERVMVTYCIPAERWAFLYGWQEAQRAARQG